MAAAVRHPEQASGTAKMRVIILKAGVNDLKLLHLVNQNHVVFFYPQTYVIHVRDVIQNVERDYKFTSQSNTVEYLLKDLEPGGRYSISVRLLNMSKEASFTLSTSEFSQSSEDGKRNVNANERRDKSRRSSVL